MPLSAGDKLGPYEILAPLGAGGMGEVYRGRDTKLDREVAVKVLPASLARDPERLARFEREAKVLASLNHPNIAQIYGVQEAEDYQALVMELVPGQTLAARIRTGAIPVDESLRLSAQMVDALSAAHEKGITHRDLKPANIMITPDGVVKVLDFGLAAMAPASGDAPGATNSPTFTMSPTSPGMIMGTAPYMSPEQARGNPADRRSDIFSFGVVLYEMLTARQLFHGETVSDILASVLKDDRNLDSVPEKVRPLLKRCLEKNPRKRLQAIGDWDLLLDRAPGSQLGVDSKTAKPSRFAKIVIAAAVVLAVATLSLGVVSYRHVREESPRMLKMSVLPPGKGTFQGNSLPAISPDGRRLAFVATTDGKDQLWVRDLDSLAARALPGTGDASYPFWSPDSHFIAFFSSDNKLKRIDVAGGPALVLCNVVLGRGGTWSKDDVIVFGVNGDGTFRIPAAGGSATSVTTRESGTGGDHRFPWFLPDGRHFLYSTSNGGARGQNAVYVADLQSKEQKRVVTADSNAVYSPPGYLLFVREQTLMAQPFDAGKLETTGEAIPIAEQVDAPGTRAAQNQFSISQNGVLAYTSGGRVDGPHLTWFDRSGKVTGTLDATNVVSVGAISPDGTTVAVDRTDQGLNDIWLYDLARNTASRFTFGPKDNQFPVWSPSGSHIAFFSLRDGIGRVFQRATGGTAKDEVLSQPPGEPREMRLDDWSRDDGYLILNSPDPKTGEDVWVLPRFGDRKPFVYLHTEFNEQFARLSPNGRWLAYTSDESKRNEIYVQSFPTQGGKWQVSTNGGTRPVWSRDGKELYFVSLDGKMMAMEIKSGSKFEAGVPKPLFDVRLPTGRNAWFDVTKDGRFLVPVPVEQTATVPMTVVVNWQAGLKK
jgi:eukaryotic-like serine/threonine-protein kinase